MNQNLEPKLDPPIDLAGLLRQLTSNQVDGVTLSEHARQRLVRIWQSSKLSAEMVSAVLAAARAARQAKLLAGLDFGVELISDPVKLKELDTIDPEEARHRVGLLAKLAEADQKATQEYLAGLKADLEKSSNHGSGQGVTNNSIAFILPETQSPAALPEGLADGDSRKRLQAVARAVMALLTGAPPLVPPPSKHKGPLPDARQPNAEHESDE